MDDRAPMIWLLGRTGVGKSSIIAALTGAPAAVGDGFTPTTAGARLYPFPPDNPALRFLDTRGLDDTAAHDPAEALAFGQAEAALLMVVLRADDLAPGAVLEAAIAARRARPGLPVIVAQTRLHDLYGEGVTHTVPYPFDGTDADGTRAAVPASLRLALIAQRQLFDQLPGPAPRFVPVDLTRPGDGLAPADYGADALWQALDATAPQLTSALRPSDVISLRQSVILPWATAAAAAEAVPVPVLGGLSATGLQAGMVRAIARRFGLEAGRGLWAEFAGLMGARFALGYGGRFMVRQVLKLAPLWGTAAVAAWSFAVTWGLGEAAAAYCAARANGTTPDRESVTQAYREGLTRARDAWRARR